MVFNFQIKNAILAIISFIHKNTTLLLGYFNNFVKLQFFFA
jgi:hypothetical protein